VLLVYQTRADPNAAGMPRNIEAQRPDCVGRIASDYCFTAFCESPDDSIWFENALAMRIAVGTEDINPLER
jgi:hypothetical protein